MSAMDVGRSKAQLTFVGSPNCELDNDDVFRDVELK